MTVLGVKTFIRVFVCLLALCPAGWAFFFLYNGDQAVQLNSVANAVLAGNSFNRFPASEAALVAAETRSICNPLEIRAASIIRLRLYEMAVEASEPQLAESRLRELRTSIVKAIGCVPNDGFLWFTAYWSAINQGAGAGDHIDELRMSYRLAPFEGWIALRSPYVLANYELLPDDLKEAVRNEFKAIVATGLIKEAVRILKSAGWRHRDTLLGALAPVRLNLRLALDRALRAEEMPALIPGIKPREFRPWRY